MGHRWWAERYRAGGCKTKEVEAEVNRFLLEPERVVPGNQMAFFGLPDAYDRAD